MRQNSPDEHHAANCPARVSASVYAVCRVGSHFLQHKDCGLVLTAIRLRMSRDSRARSSLRSTSPVSVDELGLPTQHWSLRRFLGCCPRSDVVSRRIFVQCAYESFLIAGWRITERKSGGKLQATRRSLVQGTTREERLGLPMQCRDGNSGSIDENTQSG
jgi:hypothetical protein